MTNSACKVQYTVLIPARLASSRLPNKPLADIAGLPMIVRVAQAVRAGVAPTVRIVVAADSTTVVDVCRAHGFEAVLTGLEHASGSDRLAQASQLLGLADDEIVVNVQGDEPLIDPALVASVAGLLQAHPQVSMATAAHEISQFEDFLNPNVVKVVINAAGLAMYFSRAPIPWWRDGSAPGQPALPSPAPFRHIGIYAYRVEFLKQFPTLSPAPMEITEALEQLRAMWHGYQVAVHLSGDVPGAGVDTPDDLERVRHVFLSRC